MTQLHAFVRDELARRKALRIPETRLRIEVRELDRTWSRYIDIATQYFEVLRGEAECQLEDIQPDVLYRLVGDSTLAVEVRYTHAVDDEKRRKLRFACNQSIEFDVSDLSPTGVSVQELEALLEQPQRWSWLVNVDVMHAEWRLRDEVRWMNQRWMARAKLGYQIKVSRPAVAKLRKAQTRMSWAAQQLAALKTQPLEAEAAARWLGQQDKVDRVAIACAALGLEPNKLPDVFSQNIALGLGHHPYSWQVVVFMKFGIGAKVFTSHEAATPRSRGVDQLGDA